MLPDAHFMAHPQCRAIRRHPGGLIRAFRAQAVINGHCLNSKARSARQMQKGDGIPTARHRHSDGFPRWQTRPDQAQKPPFGYWHPSPCIVAKACVAAGLAG